MWDIVGLSNNEKLVLYFRILSFVEELIIDKMYLFLVVFEKYFGELL